MRDGDEAPELASAKDTDTVATMNLNYSPLVSGNLGSLGSLIVTIS